MAAVQRRGETSSSPPDTQEPGNALTIAAWRSLHIVSLPTLAASRRSHWDSSSARHPRISRFIRKVFPLDSEVSRVTLVRCSQRRIVSCRMPKNETPTNFRWKDTCERPRTSGYAFARGVSAFKKCLVRPFPWRCLAWAASAFCTQYEGIRARMIHGSIGRPPTFARLCM